MSCASCRRWQARCTAGPRGFSNGWSSALTRRSLPQKVVIRSNAPRRKRLVAAGLDVVELPFGGILDLWTRRNLKRIVLDYKPHIVLTWMNRATGKMPKGDFV